MQPPSDADLAKRLGGANVIQAIREARDVEAVRVRVDKADPKNKGWFQWRVEPTGKPSPVTTDLANRVRTLMTDRTTYLDASDACIFNPGIKLVFHQPDHADITLLLCLHCADVCVIRNDKPIGYASFELGRAKVLDLASALFPADKDIRELIEQREAQQKK